MLMQKSWVQFKVLSPFMHQAQLLVPEEIYQNRTKNDIIALVNIGRRFIKRVL